MDTKPYYRKQHKKLKKLDKIKEKRRFKHPCDSKKCQFLKCNKITGAQREKIFNLF